MNTVRQLKMCAGDGVRRIATFWQAAKDPRINDDIDGGQAVKRLNQGIRARFDDGISQPRCTLCENAASLPVCHRGNVAARVH